MACFAAPCGRTLRHAKTELNRAVLPAPRTGAAPGASEGERTPPAPGARARPSRRAALTMGRRHRAARRSSHAPGCGPRRHEAAALTGGTAAGAGGVFARGLRLAHLQRQAHGRGHRLERRALPLRPPAVAATDNARVGAGTGRRHRALACWGFAGAMAERIQAFEETAGILSAQLWLVHG